MEDSIQVDTETMKMLSLHIARLNSYKQLVQIEEMDLHRIVQKIYGIDISQGNWRLDAQKGVLEHVPNNQPTE